jgi:hypothetical protein
MQQRNFTDVPLARHILGRFRPSSGALDPALQHMVFCTQFLVVLLVSNPGGCCVVRVYGVVGTARSNAPEDGRKRPKYVELKKHQ